MAIQGDIEIIQKDTDVHIQLWIWNNGKYTPRPVSTMCKIQLFGINQGFGYCSHHELQSYARDVFKIKNGTPIDCRIPVTIQHLECGYSDGEVLGGNNRNKVVLGLSCRHVQIETNTLPA